MLVLKRREDEREEAKRRNKKEEINTNKYKDELLSRLNSTP